jgi:beta-lactamase superfamily II metal-dependent hydrolase
MTFNPKNIIMCFTDSQNLKNHISNNMKLIRTFHPVGQGAFYTERFYDKCGKNVFNMVYDCGSSTKGQYLQNEIDKAFKDDAGKADIDLLFVSHFHHDHVNGIEELAKQYRIKQLAIPAPKLLNRDIILIDYLHNLCATLDLDNFANKFLEFCFAEDKYLENFTKSQIVPVDGKEKRLFEVSWEYLPFCDIQLSAQDFIETFIKEFLCKSLYGEFNGQNFMILYDYFKKNKNIHDLKDFYHDYFKKHYRNDNYYSMTILSKPIIEELNDTICLYTGDYPAREESCLTNLKHHYNAYWDKIDTLQAPHHGSGYDNPDSLYDKQMKNCVISYGKDNPYHHPGGNTLLAIHFSGATLHAVNEDVKYEQEFPRK